MVKITDMKVAVIAGSPVIRIITDEGITGWGQIETPKPYLKDVALQLKPFLVGQDPTNVERVMKSIRNLTHHYTVPEFACPTYRVTYQKLKEFDQDLMTHVHLENNILFRKRLPSN